ncbi:hypothetical protein [Mycobacteroides sp. CBMA 271]|uniref:hypothetical protein n=1 Tax=Mycobacteroides sp. CBMA 271 TaxID=2606608 RepID=UPI001396A6E0|nr:hypothetical protein [Mycobacteroides sp. CBMA 271]
MGADLADIDSVTVTDRLLTGLNNTIRPGAPTGNVDYNGDGPPRMPSPRESSYGGGEPADRDRSG